MKCSALRMGPRRFAPLPREFSPLQSGNPRPSRTIPFLVSRPEHLERLGSIAESLGFSFHSLETVDDLRDYLREFPAPTVWTDSHLPDGDWRDVLEICRQQSPEPPLVVTALTDSATLWVEVNEAGVAEFLSPPFAGPEVRRCLLSVTSEAVARHPVEATI